MESPPNTPSKKKKRRLTKKQTQLLVGGWIGITLLVGICIFAGAFWAITATSDDTTPDSVAGQQGATTAPLGDAPTPTQPANPGEVAATEVAGGSAAGQPTIPPRQDRSFGYGIQTQLHVNTNQTLDQIEQLGMGWVKTQIRWSDLEPAQGEANWDALNGVFTDTAARDVKLLLGVVAAPDWSRSIDTKGFVGPPDDPQAFANYLSEMLQRYPNSIHAIEVWNEPNLSERGWYTGRNLSAQEYMDLLIPTAQAIRAADPNVIIISAALAPTGVNDGVIAIDDFVYLQQLIDLGMLDYVDCVGAHANGINLPPEYAYDAGYTDPSALYQGPFANPHHSWSLYSTLRGYNDIIVAAGYDTPVCVTEFGWATLDGMEGEPLRPDFDFAYDNTVEEQSENIVKAFELMHEWGFVWIGILFNLDYSPKNGGNPKADATMFSIVYPDGSPRPAFDAVRDMPKPP